MERKIGAIILAAGKGKRMQLTDKHKSTLLLGKKSLIIHIVHFLQRLSLSPIVVVIGFAKESIQKVLEQEDILFAEQKEQLGTANAVEEALTVLPDDVSDVLIVNGDAVLHLEEQRTIVKKLLNEHVSYDNAVSFLTIEQAQSEGLGRIVRDDTGKLSEIVEEKDATDEQKRITEVNPGCYLFAVQFLKKYLPRVEKSPASGEYYITSLVDLGLKNQEKIIGVKGGKLEWLGINTQEELTQAEKRMSA